MVSLYSICAIKVDRNSHLKSIVQSTHSIPPSTRPQSPVAASGSNTTAHITKDTDEILIQLGISTLLADRSNRSLQMAYQKYKAYLEATNTYERMLADKSWTGARLTSENLINLFISKSFFHSHYKTYLAKVSNHQLLVDWLVNEPDEWPSNIEVWGVEKPSYNWQDLKEYLEDKEKKKRRKGKRKAVESPPKKREHKKKSRTKKQVK